MGIRRNGKVWASGVGWISKHTEKDAEYDKIGDGWRLLSAICRWYPDFLMDLLRSDEADYELSLLQRMILRSKARNQYCDITGCRSTTKSYCSLSDAMVEMLFWPGITESYYGPSFRQTAQITSEAYRQIEKDYPIMAKLFTVDAESSDRFQLSTPFNSKFTVAAFRGANVHMVCAEEYAQEKDPAFDAESYRRVVLPTVRLQHMVNGRPDKTYIRFKQHTITSAGRKQSHAYETRERHLQLMLRGESAFVMDVPFSALLLCQMRPIQWAENLKMELTADEWMREMESIYTGADENPIISDATLTSSRNLMVAETHHCCYDRDNRIAPQDVIYILGYDVSYADGKSNAKCAVSIIKCTKQKHFLKRDRYLKQQVYVDDWPPGDSMWQARKLKQLWARYCYPGSQTYIAIDAWQYGTSVVQALMTDLGDGLAPLCIMDHALYRAYELEGSIPVIYPVKAGGVGVTDPDAEMVRNAELQFENHNVEILTADIGAGLKAYKTYQRIKDDNNDWEISRPYTKTQEQVGQIQNLKKVVSGAGCAEKRISQHIQRDSWSALKYALRLAQRLERVYLMKPEHKSDWDKELSKYKGSNRKPVSHHAVGRTVTVRRGGRRF